MMKTSAYGWLPDLPDQRDFKLSLAHVALTSQLPARVDLREAKTVKGRSILPPVYDQGDLGSCTANAIAGAFEFAQRKIHEGYDFMPSRLFIYFNERAMEGTINEDSGAFIRDGMKSINAQGVCTETSWPYKIERFAKRPSKTCYASGEKHQSIKYERVPRDLTTMQTMLAAQIPFVFGFTVYESFESDQVAQSGILGMPGMNEEVVGGHAVLAVGYDQGQGQGQGAFIVRNSWGAEWGQQGYFTMPYDYLLNPDLSDDFWALTAIETR